MTEYFTTDEVREQLRSAQGGRTLQEFAELMDVSYQYISHVLRGIRQPGKKMLKHLGLRKLVVYQQTTYQRIQKKEK